MSNTLHGPYLCKTNSGEKCYRIEWTENGRVHTYVSTYGKHRTAKQAREILEKVKKEIEQE